MLKTWICCVSLCLFTGTLQAQSKTTNASDSLHLDWCDKNVAPQDNFYQYANGSWQKNNPIPDAYSQWNAFSVLDKTNLERIHKILIQAANNKHAKNATAEQIVGSLYASAMNTDLIEKLGTKPLQPELNKISAISNENELQQEIANLHQIGVNVLFNFTNMQDFHDSTQMIGAIVQGGLTLPNRDYYLKDTPAFKKAREFLLIYIRNMFQLLGDDSKTATHAANVILQIETKLATSSMSNIQQRDPFAIYHMVHVTKLNKIYPNFAWQNYFTSMGLPNIKSINLAMPKFMQALNKLLLEIPLNDWKIYLRWHLINEYSPYLPEKFVNENFNMSRQLSGAKTMHPRWRRFIMHTNLAIEFAMGELYVKQYFSPQRKQEVLSIMHQVRKALADDLSTLAWMQPSTRLAALKKLSLMEERVGYPDKWWDYSKLKISNDEYLLNTMRSNQFFIQHELQKIGKPIDRTEWVMPPQSVNAYYDPSMNNINIPAGILQPPFFDLNAPAAVNYGAIGWVIGHEITHGFDDTGAQFDGYGNLHNWWQPADKITFKKLTQCIINQFSKYKVGDNLFVQGKLVAGEAIADLGGLKLAYNAFHASPDFKDEKTIDGQTPDQQFFLSAAHLWANNIRPEQSINLVTVDPHPPAINRVNGTLCNIPEFKLAFKNLNDAAHVDEQGKVCKIW